jgi:hypothetical protein
LELEKGKPGGCTLLLCGKAVSRFVLYFAAELDGISAFIKCCGPVMGYIHIMVE